MENFLKEKFVIGVSGCSLGVLVISCSVGLYLRLYWAFVIIC